MGSKCCGCTMRDDCEPKKKSEPMEDTEDKKEDKEDKEE